VKIKEKPIASDLPNVTNKNRKHIAKHLPDFQRINPNYTLDDVIAIGQMIAQNSDNLVSTSGGSQAYEQSIIIIYSPPNSPMMPFNVFNVKVRAVVNAIGNLRTVHIRHN
jgi:hypothetical protein